MSDKIEPALSAEEWVDVLHTIKIKRERVIKIAGTRTTLIAPPDRCAYEIAVYNASYPDDDPRKITREMINIIREAGKRIGRERNPHLGFERNLLRYADALESYLSPER